MKQNDFYCYLAGIVDSEGCVSISKVRKGIGRALLRISNTQKEVMDFIKQRVSIGSYTSTNRKNGKEYTISWRNKDFLRISRKIEKFLVVKREQLKIAKEFQERKSSNTNCLKLSLEEIKIRQSLIEKLKSTR